MDKQTGFDSFFHEADCDIAAFAAAQDAARARLEATVLPLCQSVEKGVPIYSGAAFRSGAADRSRWLDEWAFVLGPKGPGVLVVRQAQPDHAAIHDATEVFERIIADERAAGGGADHFAAAGANDRIWNSLQKLCLAAPDIFARYHASPAIDAVCEAWLGPNYQMTAQVNVVRPGGQAQQAHRDYHLGFQTTEVAASYPAHVHLLSPAMTLQGGIAHCDMPLESGPTKLLPFSHGYEPGYLAWRRDEFRDYFEANHVQLPLETGDAIFFNPALFHAAGANVSTDIQRMVNLVQISSAFGRAMESIDRTAMTGALYPAISAALAAGAVSLEGAYASIAACAEGYSFPSNLDTDPPDSGLAPETQAALFRRALDEKMSEADFARALADQDARRRP